MAILTQETSEISGGFSKTIEEGAQDLMFNILQQHQYSMPFKSTVREIVSNGLDSLTEKHIARAILSGEAQVSDFFVEKEGAIYKDSHFNPEYYDLQYLSAVDEVDIIYTDGGETGKDKIVICDHGVGLGGNRLEKYFNLGYSSKRLLSKALGKFGIGAKAPLSVGVPFYTITSRYNGAEFCFNVYAHRVESVVPQYDMEKMVENPSYTFANGYLCYYKRTTESNMLQIEIAAKKHHKTSYIDAVQSQLLYFKNVRLFEGLAGKEQELPVRAEILYEDDMIVLSKNSAYSKPHILLNGVNYGYINFEELELEQKLGNIGIKVDPDKVSINPSRESLIWDDVTREVVVSRFHEVVKIAEATINSQLKETDFLKWLRICANASAANSFWSTADDNTVIGRLSKIVDMSKVELAYSPAPEFKYANRLMDGLRVARVEMVTEREGSKIKSKVEYQQSWRMALTEGLPIIIVQGDISNRKNKYILSKLYKSGFVMIQVQLEGPSEQRLLEAVYGELTKEKFEKAEKRITALTGFIMASADKMMYETIIVPDDFKANETEEEIEVEEKTVEATESATARRKASGTTVLHTLRHAERYLSTSDRNIVKLYEMQKIEMPIHLVDTWKNEEVFWSNSDFEPLLHTAGLLTRFNIYTSDSRPLRETNPLFDVEKSNKLQCINGYEYSKCEQFHSDSRVRLIKVAQNNVKYYKDFKHITKFFKEIKNKTITMSNALVRWNTARLLQDKIEDLRFLAGISGINPTRQSQYESITKYIAVNWRSLNINANLLGADETTTGQLIAHLDKVGQFQLFVKQNPEDKDNIAQLAQELFNPDPGVEIQDGLAIDNWVYDLYLELVDWAQPVKTMLNMVEPLTRGKPLTVEQEEEVLRYFKYRGVHI